MNRDIIQVNSFFMANNKPRKKVTGRLYFDYVVLTVHKDETEYQLNYICWLEQHVRANIESAKDMPLVAQFIDENKSEPYGHGYLTTKNGELVILDSEQVGAVVDAEIREIELGGDQGKIKALVATGYINEIRYPELSKWLKAKMFDKDAVSTSVEIVPKKGNETIVYKTANNSQGEEIDIPVEFDFAGSAILNIKPADSNAIVLEINSAKKEQKQKEDEQMDKELLEKEIRDLKESITSKDARINELETEKENLETEKTELSEQVSTLTSEKETLENEKGELSTKVESLETENAELSEFKEAKEKEEVVENFKEEAAIFSDELKEEFKAEIEDFEKEPTAEKADAIINSLNSKYVKNSIAEKEKAEAEKKEAEMRTNSLFTSVEVFTKKEKTTDEVKVWE